MSDRTYYSYEAEQHARRERLMYMLFAAGLSITVGAMLALLFAPQPGEKTRRQLGEQLSDTLNKSRHAVETTGETLIQGADKVRENLQERVKR